MAVNRVYKGDLVEVSLAKETGFRATGDNAATGWATANGTTANSSVITIGSSVYFDDLMAKNMLVGGTLRIYSSGGSNSFTSDDFPSTKRTYYITANTENTITISPRLATTGAITANTGDYFIIDSARIPTMDADMTHTTDERVKADQFLGLLNSFALPEPEVDVRKQHIVGMGRDVNILTSGREMLQGGSFDTNAHNLRWLRYALGGHTAIGFGELAHLGQPAQAWGQMLRRTAIFCSVQRPHWVQPPQSTLTRVTMMPPTKMLERRVCSKSYPPMGRTFSMGLTQGHQEQP